MHIAAWYALGLGTAAALQVTRRPLAKVARPAARSAIKGGLIVSRELQRLTEEARATLGDLTAEAKAELDQEDEAPDGDESS
jgi:hypothetical protein